MMQQSTGRRRGAFTGDEVDVHGRWRHIFTCTGRPGYTAAVKRRTNRRERREAKTEIRLEDA